MAFTQVLPLPLLTVLLRDNQRFVLVAESETKTQDSIIEKVRKRQLPEQPQKAFGQELNWCCSFCMLHHVANCATLVPVEGPGAKTMCFREGHEVVSRVC